MTPLLFLGNWNYNDEDKTIGIYGWFDKSLRHVRAHTEKPAEPGFPIAQTPLARPLTATSIPQENHNLFSVL